MAARLFATRVMGDLAGARAQSEVAMEHSILSGSMANLSWKEIERAAQNGAMVLLPCDPLEEHGPTMPIAVDPYFCLVVTRRIQELLRQQHREALIAPPNYWGICNPTAGFPGTFTLRKDTLKALLYDILACLKRWGFEHVFLISLHGDPSHRNAVVEGVAEARLEAGVRAKVIMPYRRARYSGFRGYEHCLLIQPPEQERVWDYYIKMRDYHAGSLETSMMMKYYPELLDEEATRRLAPTVLGERDAVKWQSGWSEAREVIPEGYYGNPALLEPLRAEALVESEALSHAELIGSYLRGEYVPPRLE
jgi:creatinine amidohydrolase